MTNPAIKIHPKPTLKVADKRSGSFLPWAFPVLRQPVWNNPFKPAARVDIDAWRNKVRIIKARCRYADLCRKIRMFTGELGAAARAE